MNESIKKAVSILGSQTNLANACGVTQGAVQKWLNGGGISARYIPRIVKATNGAVSAEQLLAELDNAHTERGVQGEKTEDQQEKR